ncbi:Protein of unknown function [Jatrophihabitans endophyticus]|uniref:DUF3017 domain-containing protein n=1 Tax=Jatrophihabitans endophyticus TaxID=1206085 RepID=A0A1M5GCC7_9ACTN|nr:DUF3017 domain-containing protein [Jatrophihabitans endophyticus]SHG01405.1 Protein of unknown function [Jatrophihabitans endophyticus]
MLARSWRWIREQLAFLIVLAGVVAAFGYLLVEPGHWRRGTMALGVVVLVAGVLRLTMPTARVGLLAVRSRWLDTVVYLVLGGLILAVDIRLHP